VKQYQFRLERLLEIRRHHEEQWELKLAVAGGECARLQNELRELDAAKRETLSTRGREAGTDMNYLFASELYIRRLDARSRSDANLLIEKERVRDEIRAGYLEASRKRKVLDKLKEKRAQLYRREQLEEEVKLLDDLGGSTAARRLIIDTRSVG